MFKVGDEVVYYETDEVEGYGEEFNGQVGIILRTVERSRWPYSVIFPNYQEGIFPCSEEELTLVRQVKSIEEFL